MAAGEEGDRHRRFLRRLVAARAYRRLASGDAAERRPHSNRRVLPQASAPVRDDRFSRRQFVIAPAIPFLDFRPDDDSEAIRAAIDRVIGRGWFVLGPELEAFEAEFAEA